MTKSTKDSTPVRRVQGTLYTYKGEMLSRNEIAKREGVSRQAIALRLQKHGRIPDKDELREMRNGQSLVTVLKYTKGKVSPRFQKYDYHGEQLSLKDIAKREHVSLGALYQRIRLYGSPVKREHIVHCAKCGNAGHNKATCKGSNNAP